MFAHFRMNTVFRYVLSLLYVMFFLNSLNYIIYIVLSYSSSIVSLVVHLNGIIFSLLKQYFLITIAMVSHFHCNIFSPPLQYFLNIAVVSHLYCNSFLLPLQYFLTSFAICPYHYCNIFSPLLQYSVFSHLYCNSCYLSTHVNNSNGSRYLLYKIIVHTCIY